MPGIRSDKLRIVFFVLAASVIALAGFAVQTKVREAEVARWGVRFQEFPDFAGALLDGSVGIPAVRLRDRLYTDVILHEGRLQLPFGPVPVMLFLPLAAFPCDVFPTLSVSFLLLAATTLLVHRIARSHGLRDRDAAWIAAAYSLGSAVTPLAIPIPNSWLVLLIANVFLLLALDSHLAGRRTWVTGSLLALATATRPVSAIGILSYILLTSKPAREKMARTVIGLALPLVIAVAVIGAYNHYRFGDFTETGYGLQWQADPVLADRMTFGPMDPRYVPRNLRYFLIEPPHLIGRFPFVVPDGMGMGIVFGSPYLLYILFAYKKWRRMLKPLTAAAVGLVPALTFYASGFAQIGYRYAVDVYPLLFLALIAAFGKKVPRSAKALIVLSISAHFVWVVALLT